MNIKHYEAIPSKSGWINYSAIRPNTWYQKTIECREYICYAFTTWTVPLYKKYFKPKETKWKITMEQLAAYPENTLGRKWFEFYDGQGFTMSANYEEHDITHVILGYNTSIIEETRMYSFMFGAGKISAPTILTMLIGSIFLPEFIPDFLRDYRLGKEAVDFSKWDFRFLLAEKIETLQQMILKKNVHNCTWFT